MRSLNTLSGIVDARRILAQTIQNVGNSLTQGLLTLRGIDESEDPVDPEASSEIIITASAFSSHYKELSGMLPPHISNADLSLIVEAISEEQGLIITDLALQRKEALELLRQPGIFSFNRLSLEQQKAAHQLQQYVATLGDEQFNEVMHLISPTPPQSRGTRGRVLYKTPIVGK